MLPSRPPPIDDGYNDNNFDCKPNANTTESSLISHTAAGSPNFVCKTASYFA